MTRVALLLVLPSLLLFGMAPAAPSAPAAPVHDVAVAGEGVATYPSFRRAVRRYGITTTDATNGIVEISASTTDAKGQVLVNGAPVRDGRSVVRGLVEGDEVSVIIIDSLGRTAYSFIYLPAGLSELRRSTPSPGAPEPGLVMLTLGAWSDDSDFVESAVDRHGVPAFVRSVPHAMDLRSQPNGNYSVARSTGDDRGVEIVELDGSFEEVARHSTVGLRNTDGHDALLLPDGSRYLMAYEPDPATGRTDAVVQHVSADGTVLFEWNTRDHVDVPAETVEEGADYAHINSIDVMQDGDLLLSFRHLSSVFKVARTAHDGFEVGDVVWKLGGRASDFDFVDTEGSPDGGPCAQHTASELPNGDIMVFDNGAWDRNPLCIDPGDPTGAPVARVPSRVAVWSLDEGTGLAAMTKDHQVDSRYAIFAGSAQPLPGGHTLVGWASSRDAVVSELDEDGRVVWELEDVEPPKWFSYRAHKAAVPDEIDPEVRISELRASYELGERVRPAYECTDRGGSNLRRCDASSIDTLTLGTHTFAVTARDGAGNVRTVRQDYRVVKPASRPDAMIKRVGQRRYTGRDEYGARPRQLVRATIPGDRGRRTAVVKVRNEGRRADRYRVRTKASSRSMRVRVLLPQGVRSSPRLAPGESWSFRVRVTRRPRTRDGQALLEKVVLDSRRREGRRDVVWFKVRAR